MAKKQILLILAVVLSNICMKTWRNIPKYYKGLGYTSFINALYYYLFKRHLLWEFKPGGLDWRFLRKIHTFFISPLLVLLYLSTLPTSFLKQVVHTISTVLASIWAEHFIAKRNLIFYKYGWNVLWSGFIYLQMYVYSSVFLRKPNLVWILSLFSTIFLMMKFKVPLTKRLLKGPYFLFFKKTNPSLKEFLITYMAPYNYYFMKKFKRLKPKWSVNQKWKEAIKYP